MYSLLIATVRAGRDHKPEPNKVMVCHCWLAGWRAAVAPHQSKLLVLLQFFL